MPEMTRNERKALARMKANAPQTTAQTPTSPAPPPAAPAPKRAASAPAALDPVFVQVMEDALRAHQMGRIDDAIAGFRKGIELNPTHGLAYGNMGAILSDRGEYEEAITHCQKAVTLNPDLAIAHNNLGIALSKLERHEEAVAAFMRAIAIVPNNPGALSNMTRSLIATGRLDEAETAAKKSIALKPDDAKSYSNLGMVLEATGRIEEAITVLRQAVAIGPNVPQPHKHLGLALLHQGKFAEGWKEYDWRWQADNIQIRNPPKPVWRGEPIAGKTLLLYTEQGLGDAIQFARFAPLFAGAGARVILEVHEPLVRLMRSLKGVEAVVPLMQQTPPYDFYQAVMSVPGIIGMTPETTPGNVPYLFAEPERVAMWRYRLGIHGFKVGIVWQGKCNTAEERLRSATLAHFAPLAAIPGVRLISLQKPPANAAPDPLMEQLKIESCGADFDTGPDAFIDTAAVMANLDLIITIDTSIAHVAGALGRPVWILLKHVPDWRWTMEGAQTPWYPTARLFRQRRRGDWDPVFTEVTAALTATVAAARQN